MSAGRRCYTLAMRDRSSGIVVLAALLSLGLSGCAGATQESGSNPVDSAGAPPSDDHELVGVDAPALVGMTRDGYRFDLSVLRGRVVLIDFWATWCGPCKEEMPELEAMYRRHAGKGLVVVGVSVDEEDEGIDEFVAGIPVSFPVVHDAEQVMADTWSPPNMPSTYLVDRSGRVVWMHGGFQVGEGPELEAAVVSVLEAPVAGE